MRKVPPQLWVIGVLVAALLFFFLWRPEGDNHLDAFAQCLKEKKAVFYGAFWCSHCENQKALFGKSVTFLPYVECSAPDRKSQLSVCVEKGVKNYPTWDFPDGSREVGEVSLKKLAEKTGCELPQQDR